MSCERADACGMGQRIRWNHSLRSRTGSGRKDPGLLQACLCSVGYLRGAPVGGSVYVPEPPEFPIEFLADVNPRRQTRRYPGTELGLLG